MIQSVVCYISILQLVGSGMTRQVSDRQISSNLMIQIWPLKRGNLIKFQTVIMGF